MGLVEFARNELKMAGLFDKDSDYGGMLGKAVMKLVKVFSKQGHSGASAERTLSLFQRVADYKPLLPLTLKDEEWTEVREGLYWNKRNFAVFKDGRDGKPYYSNAYVMVAKFPDGHESSWSGSLAIIGGRRVGRCFIKDVNKMPTVRIEIPVKIIGGNKEDWEFLPVSEDKLCELKRYYDLEIIKDAL